MHSAFIPSCTSSGLHDCAVVCYPLLLLLLLLAAVQQTLLAALQRRPFTTAAVCEAAVRSAARHNQVAAGCIRCFAQLVMDACAQIAASSDSSNSSSSSRLSDVLAAAVTNSSTRDALLLQFALITTQLKYASGGRCSTSVVSGLLHYAMPTCQTLVAMGKLIERPLGIDSDSGSSSVSSSSVEQQRERVRAMVPWIHLAGRCLFFAGSQLLLVLEDPAAARAAGMNAKVTVVMEQVRFCICLLLYICLFIYYNILAHIFIIIYLLIHYLSHI